MKCLADNILVTGGAGFIGSTLVRDLIEKGNTVTVVNDLSMGRLSNLPESDQLTFDQKSIIDWKFMDELLMKHQFDYIYLLAAVASVADTIERPEVTHQINQDANLWIMETLRRNQLRPKKVIFTSSRRFMAMIQSNPKVSTHELCRYHHTPLTNSLLSGL